MGHKVIEPALDMVQWQMIVANKKEFMKLQNKNVLTAQSTTGLCLC